MSDQQRETTQEEASSSEQAQTLVLNNNNNKIHETSTATTLNEDSDSDGEEGNLQHHENPETFAPIPREKLEFDWDNPVLDLAHHPHEQIGAGYPLGAHLQYLDLTNCRLRKIENLDHLKNLETLLLRQNLITKVEGLKNLESLKHLDLYGNQIKRVDASELNSLTNLE